MRRDPATTAQPEAGPNTRSAAARGNDDFINLGEIIAVLLEYKWLILAIGTFAVLVGAVVAFVSTPIYRADALVQVEDKKSAQGGLAACAPATWASPIRAARCASAKRARSW